MTEVGGNGGTASEGPHESGRIFTMLGNSFQRRSSKGNIDTNKLTNFQKTTRKSRLGVSDALAFYDVYSLYDADMMAMVPRSVFALLTTIPMTEAWKTTRDEEDVDLQWYKGSGKEER